MSGQQSMKTASVSLERFAVFITLICSCTCRRDIKSLAINDERCLSTLQPLLQKVAFMFLVSGEMPHAAMWTRWFSAIRGVLPATVLCEPEAVQCLQMLPKGSANEVYASQHLFTIYVHTKPEYEGYPEGSLFHNRVISTLLPTGWGEYSLAAATRLLITEALKDPLNQRFQLLCQATIPLHPPLMVYTQLIAENMSRINWYPANESPFHRQVGRFPLPMFEDFPDIEGNTRFHRQFITLIRQHAQVIADDNTINPLFERHCFMAHEQRGHFCISDEQYFGTAVTYFLSIRGEDLQEHIMGTVAVAMAISGGGFSEEDITEELLVELRTGSNNATVLPYVVNSYGDCQAHDRLNMTMGALEDAENICSDYAGRGSRDEPTQTFENCHLFARKFLGRTVDRLQPLLEQLNIIT